MVVTNTVEECIDETLKKHQDNKERFAKEALKEIFNNYNYNYFTNENNARDKMKILGRDALIVELVYGALISREYQIMQGITRDNRNAEKGLPINISQAQNYIYDKINREISPVVIVAEIQCSSILREFLIANYAHLLATTTKEERENIRKLLSRYIQNKLDDLDKLQTFFIDEYQNKIIQNQMKNTTNDGTESKQPQMR